MVKNGSFAGLEATVPAKARERRALQTLRDLDRTSLLREAFGVRRIPPLSGPAIIQKC
jgi:hypothetical protein